MTYRGKEFLPLFRGAGPCQLCGVCCRGRECAHVMARASGGGKTLNLPINLLALGPACACACHHRGHNGKVNEWDLYRAVGRREGLDYGFVREQLWRLTRAPRECRPCMRCLGAGSVKVERLYRAEVFARHPCVCGTGILGPDGEPYVEAERGATWQA